MPPKLAVNCLMPFGPIVSADGEIVAVFPAVTTKVRELDSANGVSSAKYHFHIETLTVAGEARRSAVTTAVSWVGLITEADKDEQVPTPHHSTSVWVG